MVGSAPTQFCHSGTAKVHLLSSVLHRTMASGHSPSLRDDWQVPLRHSAAKRRDWTVPVGHALPSLSGYHGSFSHRQTPIGHRQTPIGHRQTPIGHRQTPIGHRQTPKNGWNTPFFARNGLGNRFVMTMSPCAPSWHRACLTGSVSTTAPARPVASDWNRRTALRGSGFPSSG